MSAHKTEDNTNAPNMITPPIVGVPLFISKCHLGPSNLMGCPSFCLDLSQFIILGEKIKTIIKEVMNAATLLNDKYLTIFKKLYSSIREDKKRYNN